MTEPYYFAIAGEDDAHFVVVRAIMKRCLVAAHDWIDDLLVDGCWVREALTTAVKRVKELFPRGFGSPLHGKFDGLPDSRMVRAQLFLWHDGGWPFDIGVIARDIDRDPRRRDGAKAALDHARERGRLKRTILLAHPVPEIEAWLVAAFEPRDATERQRLESEVRRLGFDPTAEPERLTSKNEHEPKDAKRVWRTLSADDPTRRDVCLAVAFDAWKRRGAACGLAAFVDACETTLPRAVTSRS